MPEPLLIQRQRTVLRDLGQLAGDRAQAEARIEGEFASSKAAAEKQFEEERQRLFKDHQAEQERIWAPQAAAMTPVGPDLGAPSPASEVASPGGPAAPSLP